MALSGAQKAALFLTTLDPGTARELLRDAPDEVVRDVSAELAYLDATGQAGHHQVAELMQEFVGLLQSGPAEQSCLANFGAVLRDAVGEQSAAEILSQAQDCVFRRDPFVNIRRTEVGLLAKALSGEAPQVAALVLAELPADKSTALLVLLDDETRTQAVRGMVSGGAISSQTRVCVARIIEQKLQTLRKESPGDPAPSDGQDADPLLRKVALLLRGLEASQREPMLQAVAEENPDRAENVRRLMVVWEDLPALEDRSLQDALRSVNSTNLAMAMVGADPSIIAKVRQNISERASSMLDEEAGLLSSPKKAEIDEAREQVLSTLREMSNGGELGFADGGA